MKLGLLQKTDVQENAESEQSNDPHTNSFLMDITHYTLGLME